MRTYSAGVIQKLSECGFIVVKIDRRWTLLDGAEGCGGVLFASSSLGDLLGQAANELGAR